MYKSFLVVVFGVLVGLVLGYFLYDYSHLSFKKDGIGVKGEVIGFLPYWLVDKADADYSKVVTRLDYFSLSIDGDGSIVKLANAQELDPGWNNLRGERVKNFFAKARGSETPLSLVVFTGDSEVIGDLVSDPIKHADNLYEDLKPLIEEYGFKDINLDIEDMGDVKDSDRASFVRFVREVKERLGDGVTLTVEVSPLEVVKEGLVDLGEVGKIADWVVLMAYDYHAPNSQVTGAIAPLYGAGTTFEYDVATAVEMMREFVPAKKIILGVPLYGYEWETIGSGARSAIIPGTGVLASNRRVEELLDSCESCSVEFDKDAQESYLVYKDQDSGTYHQVFFGDEKAMRSKIEFVNREGLGGIALWALGYEGKEMLSPLMK